MAVDADEPPGQPPLPPALARLWRDRGRGAGGSPADGPGARRARRGRPARLTVQDVVAAAARTADRAGVEAVTVAAVAAELGASPMSLYRHVSSKQELLLLLADEGAGPPPPTTIADGPWREGLRSWAMALRQRHRDRPWLARLPIAGPPSGPQELAWLEVALRCLRDTRLGPAERLSVITLVSGYVRHSTLLAQDLAAGRAAAGHWQHLPRLLDPERHAALAAVLADLAEQAADHRPTPDGGTPGGPPDDLELTDADVDYGLERVLDGIAAVA